MSSLLSGNASQCQHYLVPSLRIAQCSFVPTLLNANSPAAWPPARRLVRPHEPALRYTTARTPVPPLFSMPARTRARVHARTRASTHAHTHALAHTRAPTHMRTHARVHIRVAALDGQGTSEPYSQIGQGRALINKITKKGGSSFFCLGARRRQADLTEGQ